MGAADYKHTRKRSDWSQLSRYAVGLPLPRVDRDPPRENAPPAGRALEGVGQRERQVREACVRWEYALCFCQPDSSTHAALVPHFKSILREA